MSLSCVTHRDAIGAVDVSDNGKSADRRPAIVTVRQAHTVTSGRGFSRSRSKNLSRKNAAGTIFFAAL
jgi:hypothetical protein